MTTPPEPRADVERRFWAKVQKTDGCWWWLGSVGEAARPYGGFWLRGRLRRAHRVAWELAHGREIPEGMDACHTCDEPRCVRPDHIFVATKSANQRDSVAKGRHAKANNTHCAVGHAWTPENTRVTATGWRRCRTCENAAKRSKRLAIRARAQAAPGEEGA